MKHRFVVKLHGDTLVILRSGRLFTVRLPTTDGLRSIDSDWTYYWVVPKVRLVV